MERQRVVSRDSVTRLICSLLLMDVVESTAADVFHHLQGQGTNHVPSISSRTLEYHRNQSQAHSASTTNDQPSHSVPYDPYPLPDEPNAPLVVVASWPCPPLPVRT